MWPPWVGGDTLPGSSPTQGGHIGPPPKNAHHPGHDRLSAGAPQMTDVDGFLLLPEKCLCKL